MKRNIGLMAGGALVGLTLIACHAPHPHMTTLRTIASLDCPDSQGELTRKSVAADGKSCAYATDSGDEVTLQLVSLDGKTSREALAPIEAQVKSEAATPPPAPPVPPGPPMPPEPPRGDKDRVDIDLPGIHIHSTGNGHANIDTAGVHVEAHDHDGHGDQADVQIGDGADGKGVTVNASDGRAQIRVDDSGASVNAVYMLVSETPGPHGYKAVGYEARGPKTGPLAVAVILAKSEDHDDLRHDIRQLLRRNVGG